MADPDLLLQKPGGPRVIRESQVQDRNGTWFEINQDAPFTGQVVGFFQNRQKRIESNYLAGRLHGARSEWFENGQEKRVSVFDQGRLHGVETTWFRDGAKAMETQYQAGRRHGVHRLWHASGKLAMETPYVKGEPHGLTRQWHANGKIAREVRWESGRQLAFDTWTAEGVRFGEGTNTVSLLHAKYKLEVHREVAQVQAEFQLEARAANQKFTLFRELIAINDFNASQAGAKLLREGPALVLQLPEAGKVTVNLSFLTKHAGDATRRTLAFGIPPALTSVVDVVLQEADSEVEMPTAVKFDTSSGGNQTLVDAIIGASDRLELAWKPRVKKAREIAATVFTQTASVVAFGNNRVSTHTVINYSISQGELRETKVVLPPGKDWKLMKVDGGKQLRTYQLDTQDGQSVLTALLVNGVTQKFQLTLELERGLPAPPIAMPVLLPRSLAGTVQRETGYIALQSSAELGLSMDQANGLTQVDVQEFARSTKQAVPTNATAFAYNTPSYTLAAQVESIEPEIEAVARHLTHITEEKLRVTTHVEYTIKHVGVFKFELALPEGSFDVEGVRGPGNPQWEEKPIDGTRRLVVTLKQRTSGQYPLRVDLSQSLATLPAQITARGAHPLGVHKLTNLVGVYAEEGVVVVEVADSRSQALNEMSTARLAATAVVVNPPNAPPQQRDGVGDIPGIPANANALAYRHFNETPANTPAWTLEVATRRLEPWVRNAQIVNWMRLGQTRVSGYTRVRYEVERAPVRQFTLLLPNNFNTNHTRFTGAGIRSRESKPTDLGRLYTITLQDKVRPGEIYTLNINWELASWDVVNNGTLVFQGPMTQGKNLPAATQARYTAAGMDLLVEGEEGWLVVSDDPRAQLMLEAGDNLTGLERKNTGDLPEWAAAGSEGARQVWYYFRPGYSLTLNAKMLKDAAVDPAWINQALFRSVVADDGQMMTHMALSVNNNGKQFLGITLPGDNPRVLSVFVNGQARRPTRKEGRILVPLEHSSDIGAFPVEMVYTSEIKFPRDGGRVEIKSPQFDVKLNSAKWRFYLPEDYKYSDYKGTMDFLQRGLQRQPSTALSDWRQNDDRKKQTEKYFNTIDEMERADEEQYSNSLTTGELAGGKLGNTYSQETYAAQERFNTKKALDNIARSQAIVISNLESGKLATANRASGQSFKNLNDLAQQVRGKGTKDENKQLELLLTNQRDLDSRRRTAQVRQEQKAQYEFNLRNSDLAKTPRRNAGNAPNFASQTSRALLNGPGQMGGMVGGGMGGGGGMMGKMGQQGTPVLVTDAETNERQARQVEEIERIQKRVADGTITPLYINLPTHGEPYAFNQPLQTDTGAPMTVSFEVENTRRTNWMTLILWSTLALAVLHLMVNLIRQLALRNPRAAKA